jgi:hypothetical protein
MKVSYTYGDGDGDGDEIASIQSADTCIYVRGHHGLHRFTQAPKVIILWLQTHYIMASVSLM